MDYHHCFVGIPVVGQALDKLADYKKILCQIYPEFKTGNDEYPHITLLFLGDCSLEELQKVHKDLQSNISAFAPVKIQSEELGYFNNKYSKPIFLEVLEGKEVKYLKLQVFHCLQSYSREGSRVKSHITLGRAKKEITADALNKIISDFKEKLKSSGGLDFAFTAKELAIIGRQKGRQNSPQEKLFDIPLS